MIREYKLNTAGQLDLGWRDVEFWLSLFPNLTQADLDNPRLFTPNLESVVEPQNKKSMEKIYVLQQGYQRPGGVINAGTEYPVDMWLKIFPDLTVSDLDIKTDWFLPKKKKEQEWEITAYKYKERIYNKNFIGEFVTSGAVDIHLLILHPSNQTDIYSVKRLSDGQTFSVGDETTYGIIKRFMVTSTAESGMYVFNSNDGWICLSKYPKKQPPQEEIKKPPLGVTPAFIHKEQMLDDIMQAMNRFNDFHNHTKLCPQEWLDEKHELEEWLLKFKASKSTQKAVKPPLGVVPEFIIKEQRLQDIRDAFKRYIDSSHTIPREWIDEENEICKWLWQHYPTSPLLTEIDKVQFKKSTPKEEKKNIFVWTSGSGEGIPCIEYEGKEYIDAREAKERFSKELLQARREAFEAARHGKTFNAYEQKILSDGCLHKTFEDYLQSLNNK